MMLRRTVQNLLFLVPLAVWTGAAVGLTFLTTPVIFAALDRDAASRLVSQLFPGYFRLGLLCLTAALVAAVAMAWPARPRRWWLTPALLAAALALMLVAGLVLEPRVAAVQARIPSFITDTDSPARQEFRTLHSLSSMLNVVVMALTATVWVVTALDPRPLLGVTREARAVIPAIEASASGATRTG
jgi:hypothetical protein